MGDPTLWRECAGGGGRRRAQYWSRRVHPAASFPDKLAAMRDGCYSTHMDIQCSDISDRIAALPPAAQAEVADFVEFLSDKARRQAAWDRLLAIAPALEAAGQPACDEAELAAEIDAARAERRSLMPN